ncbi:MAG: ABC transporter permease [Candidatus Rokubacteria bacterium]|nr:ABC transporter permease [Candidatus Rokubacteria bacterium]
MYLYLARRLLATIPVMGVVALFVFGLLHLAPGDPAAIIAGDLATTQDIERIRENLGLNASLHVQFGTWVGQLLRGDLGVSIFSNVPVTRLIRQRVEPTAALTTTTLILAIVVAVPMGVVAAWKAGSWIDQVIMVLAVVGFSCPVFVLGYVLIYGFSVQLQLLPVQGYVSPSQGLGPFLRSIALPTLTLGLVYIALIARMTRATVLEVLGEDYIRTANAKGLGTGTVLISHALKNAAVPIVTTVGVGVALLIGGAVITESVFAIPGLGRLVVDAILRRDYPVIQGVILIFSAAYVLINLAVDIVYTLLDPRIRY